MRERKAARLLVVSPARTVLLFRFVHKDGALAGRNYWATPGGGVEAGETFSRQTFFKAWPGYWQCL